MLLFYIRHGDPIYTPDSLTPKGELQAAALAKRLALYGLDEIYVSTSNRAKLTAQPTCELLKLTPIELDWCHENHAWKEFSIPDEGGRRRWIFQASTKSLLISPEVRALDKQWYRHPLYSDNTLSEAGMNRVQAETDAFMEQLGYVHTDENNYRVVQHNDRRVALFAHQGFGLAFLSCLLDLPYPMVCSHLDMGHSGMTVIEFSDLNGISIPKVLQFSNDSHLYREGLPTDYQNRIRF